MKRFWIIAACVLSVLTVLASLYLHRHPFIKDLAVGMFELAVNDPTPKWTTVRSSETHLEFLSPFPVTWDHQRSEKEDGTVVLRSIGTTPFNRSGFSIIVSKFLYLNTLKPIDTSNKLASNIRTGGEYFPDGETSRMESITCSGMPATQVIRTSNKAVQGAHQVSRRIWVAQGPWLWRFWIDYSDKTEEQDIWAHKVIDSIRIKLPESVSKN